MSSFERILVAVDVLRPSKTVVKYGVSLALQFNAKLRLAHIIPSIPLLYSAPSENDALTREIAYAKATLPSLVPKEHRRQLDLQAIVGVGDIPSELGKIVDDEKIDLVAMAAPGWHPLETFLLGSLAERIHRPVPVLTVPRSDSSGELHTAGRVPLRHILYATALSETGAPGLNFSVELARRTSARLTVLHVMRPFAGELSFELAAMEAPAEDAFTQIQFSILEQMRDLVEAAPVVLEGTPHREILRFIEEEKVDLVVLNRGSRNHFQRALLGSTADQVIRRAQVPVLAMPISSQPGPLAGATAHEIDRELKEVS
jgi:nucleotide-binding universal stress UspA family protein